MFANSWPSASNFKSFSQSLEHFFLTAGQNNFDNKIPFVIIKLSIFFQHNSSMHLRQIKDSLPVAVEEMGVGEGMGEALEAVVGVS